MRILVWNMNKQERAWQHLLSVVDTFDVALLQEVRDPRVEVGRAWASAVWRPMRGEPGSRRTLWGSAVVAPTLTLDQYDPGEQFPWLQALGGSVTVARHAGSPTWFASVHAHAGRVPRELLDAHPWDDVPV